MSTIESFYHNQHRIEIWPDHGAESPLEYSDARVVVLHGRYINPSPEIGSTPEQVDAWCKDNESEYCIYPLWMYDHGSTVYRAGDTNPFHCPWDSGQVGIIALPRGKGHGPAESGVSYLDTMNMILDDYTRWANGGYVGFSVLDSDGETIDSCGGFDCIDYAKEQAMESIDG